MTTQSIHLFVFDTLSDWEAAFAIAGLNNPAFQAQPGRYQVKTVGTSKEPVKSIGGMTILPDLTLDELNPEASAMLILPGGDGWGNGQHMRVLEKAQQFLEAGVPLAAICGATEGLARAGILDDKRHTSNARAYLQATRYKGEAFYQEEPAVTDGNVITASAMSALEFAYHIFKKLDVYPDETLEAWYNLYKTGDPSYFFALQKANNAS